MKKIVLSLSLLAVFNTPCLYAQSAQVYLPDGKDIKAQMNKDPDKAPDSISYGAYGKAIGALSTHNFQFGYNRQYRDETTGLSVFKDNTNKTPDSAAISVYGSRDYNSAMHVFNTRSADPSVWNRYAYAHANPIMNNEDGAENFHWDPLYTKIATMSGGYLLTLIEGGIFTSITRSGFYIKAMSATALANVFGFTGMYITDGNTQKDLFIATTAFNGAVFVGSALKYAIPRLKYIQTAKKYNSLAQGLRVPENNREIYLY